MATLTVDDAPGAARPRERGRRSPLWWAVVALPAAAAVAYTVLTRRLTGDLHYVLGALRTGDAAGWSPSEVFTHRPFFYRWFVAGLDVLTFGGVTTREAIMAAVGVLLAAAAAYALHTALLRRVTGREAALTAGATGLALALAPRTDFLQPEWAAVVLTVFGIAAVLGLDRPWPAALLGTLPMGLAVMMKYSTAATAAVGLLLVYVVDRGRAVRLGLLTAAGSIGLFGLSLLAGSREWRWTEDMPRINQDSFGRTGLDLGATFHQSVAWLADRAILTPVLLLLPGALLLVLSRVRGRRRLAELLLVAVVIGLGALGSVVVQGNWFSYHGAQLPVLAAALWGLAVGGARRSPPWFFGAVSLAYGVLPVLYTGAPEGLQRPATAWALCFAALVAAGADTLVAARRNRSGRRTGPRGVGAAAVISLAGVVCLTGAIWPGSPHRVLDGKVMATSTDYLHEMRDNQAVAARLGAAMPQDAPVLYLAFGDTAYYLDHPVQCRYPIATFLQRTRFIADVAELPSYRENADCVDHDPAPYAVLDWSWFRPGSVDPALQRRISAVYDCPPAPAQGDKTVLCTRKNGAGQAN
ncbi:hypothetical protein ACIHCM_15145 [Streptomyces sp. NPDC052023]|uniref:hypothetical protein n=1 Tax=Streptomyces sp. NPDC052023 TaxID=3365681 RepID=UPI0037CEF0AF